MLCVDQKACQADVAAKTGQDIYTGKGPQGER